MTNNIIIPVRNRDINKNQYIESFASTGDFKLFFIHQKNELAFNRGILKNIGFLESRKINPCEFLFFNDVDNIPQKLGVKLLANKNEIKHLYGHDFSLGGIFSTDYETFEKTQGFPNDYWGWGVEDVTFQFRAMRNKIKIDKSALVERNKKNEGPHIDEFNFIPMEHRNSWKISWDKYNVERQTTATSGLNNISYEVNKISKIQENIYEIDCNFHREFKILKYEYKDIIPNIGDAIQSLALEEFLNKFNIKISGYTDRSKMEKDTIINGHHRMTNNSFKEAFPKRAIFLGIHSEKEIIKEIEKGTIVGARDPYTYREIEKTGDLRPIFVGCVTSTFKPYDGERDIESSKMFHWRGYDCPKNSSWTEQMKFACELLEIIKRSKIIYTDRLHVAIPAIAFGTPVVLTPRNFQPERYSIFECFREFPGFGKTILPSCGLREAMKERFHYGFGFLYNEYLAK